MPVGVVALSLMFLLSPSLALAPLNALQPGQGPPAISQPLVARPHFTDPGIQTAGPLLPPTSSRARVATAQRFEAALDAALQESEAEGATFAVVRDGAVMWTGASGRDHRDGRGLLAADEPLVMGSITKTYVAAAILQLVQEGVVALDDAVRDHLPALSGLDREITIRHLLDHTSGLADLFNATTRLGLDEQPQRSWSAKEMLDSLHDPWHDPGDGWSYANTNYYLLGMLVESVTGASLADELHRRFLVPLGLGATRMLAGADTLEPAWNTLFWASGTMSGSAADVARWGDALYDGSVLTRASLDDMTDVNDHDYGLGLQRIELDGAKGHGHSGLLHSYTSLLFHLPDEGVTLALLVNRSRVDLGDMLLAEPEDGGPSLLDLARDAGS